LISTFSKYIGGGFLELLT